LSTEPEILETLKEIRDLLKQDNENQIQSQLEMNSFLKQQMEESKARGNMSLELQKSAVRRQKFMLKIVVPLLILGIVFMLYPFLNNGH